MGLLWVCRNLTYRKKFKKNFENQKIMFTFVFMNKATEQDFIDLMNLLQKREDQTRSFVMITGLQGFENFNFSMMEIDVYISINNTRYNFKKVPYLWIFNLYEKHGPYKITLNCKTKKFTAYFGTRVLGVTNTAESAFKLYIKKHKNGQ